MDLADFTNNIRDHKRIFVELSGSAKEDFTSLESTGVALRNAAKDAGVLVFLPEMQKIFAQGHYYGVDPDDWDALAGRITTLENTINNLEPPLASLAGLIATNTANLNKLITLVGGSELPQDTNNILSRISTLEAEVGAITGEHSLSEAVESIVDARLNSVLNTRIENYLTENNYIQEDDLGTINDALQTMSAAIDLKAAQSSFNDLIGLIGASNINAQAWGNQDTMVTVINNLNDTTQTMSLDLSNLTDDVSDLDSTVTTLSGLITTIPKFEIKVVQSLPTGNEGDEISKSTIYLLAPASGTDPDDQELFTEYIYINKNSGKINSETGEEMQPEWVWEKLGRQYFKIDNYFTKAQIEEITQPLVNYISEISQTIDANTSARITTNTNNISSLDNRVTALETAISKFDYLIDSNGDLVFTGEDILTRPNSNITIADALDMKVNTSALDWLILDGTESNNNNDNNG